MEFVDLSGVEAGSNSGAGYSKRLPDGEYICVITAVKDEPTRKFLKIEFDIAEGEHAGHYADLYAAHNFWGGILYRSYTKSALPFFKQFVQAIENSNNGFKFDGESEQSFVGKRVGFTLEEENYQNNSGDTKKRMAVVDVWAVAADEAFNDEDLPF